MLKKYIATVKENFVRDAQVWGNELPKKIKDGKAIALSEEYVFDDNWLDASFPLFLGVYEAKDEKAALKKVRSIYPYLDKGILELFEIGFETTSLMMDEETLKQAKATADVYEKWYEDWHGTYEYCTELADALYFVEKALKSDKPIEIIK